MHQAGPGHRVEPAPAAAVRDVEQGVVPRPPGQSASAVPAPGAARTNATRSPPGNGSTRRSPSTNSPAPRHRHASPAGRAAPPAAARPCARRRRPGPGSSRSSRVPGRNEVTSSPGAPAPGSGAADLQHLRAPAAARGPAGAPPRRRRPPRDRGARPARRTPGRRCARPPPRPGTSRRCGRPAAGAIRTVRSRPRADAATPGPAALDYRRRMALLDLVTLPVRLTVAAVDTTLALGQLVDPEGPVRRQDGYADRLMLVIGRGGLVDRLTARLSDPHGPMHLVNTVTALLDERRPVGRALAPGGTVDRMLAADGPLFRLVAEGGTVDRILAEGGAVDRLLEEGGALDQLAAVDGPLERLLRVRGRAGPGHPARRAARPAAGRGRPARPAALRGRLRREARRRGRHARPARRAGRDPGAAPAADRRADRADPRAARVGRHPQPVGRPARRPRQPAPGRPATSRPRGLSRCTRPAVPVSEAETQRANRREWDAYADEYQATHGEFLRDVGFLWCPEGVDEADAHVLGEVAGRDVLEVGCGAAQCARWLVTHGARPSASTSPSGSCSTPGASTTRAGVAGPGGRRHGDRAAVRRRVVRRGVLGVRGAAVRAGRRPRRRGDGPGAAAGRPVRVLGDPPGALDACPTTRRARGWWSPAPTGTARRTSRRTTTAGSTYVEHHRTLGDWVGLLAGAGLRLTGLLEPEWPEGHDRVWGGWGPERGRLVPGTAILAPPARRLTDARVSSRSRPTRPRRPLGVDRLRIRAGRATASAGEHGAARPPEQRQAAECRGPGCGRPRRRRP